MATIQNRLPEGHFATLIHHSLSLINLSFACIKDKYKSYPLCIREYLNNEPHKKSIEIRFEKEQALLICTFDKNGTCERTSVHMNHEDLTKQLVDYLSRHHYYNYLRGRWEVSGSFLKIDPVDGLLRELRLVVT